MCFKFGEKQKKDGKAKERWKRKFDDTKDFYFSSSRRYISSSRRVELILHCDTATEGCVSNDFFRHSLDDSPASYLT